MAHNLAKINGKIAMAYDGETPWHRLGTRTPGMTSVAAALTAASLDWPVNLRPLHLDDGRRVKNRQAVLRSDDVVLGVVTDRWRPIQNADAFGILDDACREFGVTIECAGALGRGERTWMLAKMPQTIEPAPGDTVNGYFLVSNGHDGVTAWDGRITPIRVVCQNTLIAATQGTAGTFYLRHDQTAGKRLDMVRDLVTRMAEALTVAGETFGALAQTRLTPDDVVAYINRVLPGPKGQDPAPQLIARRQRVADLVWHGAGADLAGSDDTGTTAWAVYNAVTEYVDHVHGPATSQTDAGQLRSARSAIFGDGALLKLQALQAARQLVAAN